MSVQITAKMVGELRESTGGGLMNCKKALVETEGDFEKLRIFFVRRVKQLQRRRLVVMQLKA